MYTKPIEYWFAVATLVVYTAFSNAEKEPLRVRLVKTIVSAGLTVALSPSIAEYLKISETWTSVVIMCVGFAVLDVLKSLMADREFVKSLIRNWVGKGKE